MNREFWSLLMDKTDFPAEAKSTLLAAGEKLSPEAFDGAVEFFRGGGFNVEQTQTRVDALAETAGLSPYTVWMLLLMEAAAPVREDWAKKGRPESLFWDTFSDLRCKALECRENKGVWGTFVAFWYPIFYTDNIVKLGRLEYETCGYYFSEPFTRNGLTLREGTPVLNIHIPSSGEPFDQKARQDSYRQACAFFRDRMIGGVLPCVCHSWLLNPDYAPLLPPDSNIRSFQQDFEIIGKDAEDSFGDSWRLYGLGSEKPVEDWPENTRMQRSFKEYFLQGGKPGAGKGVLLLSPEQAPASASAACKE